MRKRTIKKQIWINQDEDNLLKQKAKKCGLNESEFLRSCIKGYKIKEQPTREIIEFTRQITGIANNINQIARAVNTVGYLKEDLPPVQNYKKKYYKKTYTGIKINQSLLQKSSFYRLYVHYLYFFGILPAKNQYKELSPEYYKQKRKNNMIFEELNFLARHSFSSIADVKKYKGNLENKLPELKWKRELLWRKHKSSDENNKTEIIKEMNALTEEIDKIQAQKNACNRIVARYEKMKMECSKDLISKQNMQEFIFKNNNIKLKNR